jgi:hypothetical protein
MGFGYRPFYNSQDWPDALNPPYVANPDEGGLIQVEVAAPYLPEQTLWPWILGALALFYLLNSREGKPE